MMQDSVRRRCVDTCIPAYIRSTHNTRFPPGPAACYGTTKITGIALSPFNKTGFSTCNSQPCANPWMFGERQSNARLLSIPRPLSIWFEAARLRSSLPPVPHARHCDVHTCSQCACLLFSAHRLFPLVDRGTTPILTDIHFKGGGGGGRCSCSPHCSQLVADADTDADSNSTNRHISRLISEQSTSRILPDRVAIVHPCDVLHPPCRIRIGLPPRRSVSGSRSRGEQHP
ncbi:hypothetical protein LY76DRAFT_31597 [Colletotrichum caudatum]|nr:hypothetical protein LY76DRAFT_31597 [Colletotrichum caudatum]